MRLASFRWRHGFLVVREGPEGLVVEGGNSRITFGAREVVVEGLFQGVREKEEGGRGQVKLVYIDFAFPLRGREAGEGTVFQRPVDLALGSYGVSYTPLEGVGYYLTIYPPSGALYDHAVISEDLVLLVTIRRRQVYTMVEDARGIRVLRVILV